MSKQRGGRRLGAGRPTGSGKYGEPTQLVRLPESMLPTVQHMLRLCGASSLPEGVLVNTNTPLTESVVSRGLEQRLGGDQSYGDVCLMAAPEKRAPRDYTFGEGVFSVIKVAEPDEAHPYQIPFYESRVAAGFPSPASDGQEGEIDLNTMLVRHPASTFLVRVQGESMIGAGIHPNDVLVVDRSIQATNGKVVIAVIDGEMTVKRLSRRQGRVLLLPENPSFPPIEISEQQAFMVWGVVTSVIHSVD